VDTQSHMHLVHPPGGALACNTL